MAMTLKYVLDGQGGQADLAGQLAGATAAIRANVAKYQTKADLAKLEHQLNGLFYPVGNSAISDWYFQQAISLNTEESLYEAFDQFDFESNTGGYQNNTQRIKISTVQKALDTAVKAVSTMNAQLENLPESVNKEQLLSLLRQVQQRVAEGQQIAKQAEQELGIGSFISRTNSGGTFDDIMVIVNQLRAFSSTLYNGGLGLVTPQQAGLIFEKALALADYKDTATEDTIPELVEQLSNAGQKVIARGGGLISYTMDINAVDLKEARESKHFKINEENMTVTYSYNPGAAKQGKMDVQLTFGDPTSQNYRISAKRWGKGTGDLGSTSIDAGITRTAGVGVAEAYKLAVLTPSQDQLDVSRDGLPSFSAVSSAHEMAQLALKADIAMGYGQGEAGYANVLVVDNGNAIKVFDIASIVNTYRLSGYNSGSIQSVAINNYNSMKNVMIGRTNHYLGAMTSSLNKMQVTIRLNAK